jgi:outer membrane protein assembly factor BamB
MNRMTSAFVRSVCVATLITAGFGGAARGDDWPQWRGAKHDGISRETNVPVKFGKDENLVWRLPLPKRAGSTPVIWGDRIFLTSPAEDDDTLLLICASTQGKILWQREMGKGNRNSRGTEGNSASPSPATNGKHVWAFQGTGVLGCYDVDGNEVWKFDLQDRYGKFNIAFGMTSTPVLDGDRLYLQLIHGDGNAKTREAVVVCLDTATGKEIWRQPRPSEAYAENEHSYASPTLYRDEQQSFLLTHGADFIIAHSLEDGHELWRCGGLQPDNYDATLRLVSSPVAVPGLIVAPSAKGGRLVAIRPGGQGDITATDYKLWRFAPTPDVPSPLIVDDLVYLFRENSILICLDAKTGAKQYEQRLCSSENNRASPLYANGHIYLAARNGTITVVKAGRIFEQVWQTSLEDSLTSSPVIANGRLYLRTNGTLWAFGSK